MHSSKKTVNLEYQDVLRLLMKQVKIVVLVTFTVINNLYAKKYNKLHFQNKACINDCKL